jgi:hypothetical protein
MSDSRLLWALKDGITPRQSYETLNKKVFFWMREQRLRTLLGARAHRALEHDVLTVNMASLVSAHQFEIWLCQLIFASD